MTEPKDASSFFRKVVKFVSNPTVEWGELSQLSRDPVDTELDKAELRAMVERKRRNDFVRKREFDMLRKARREGLTPEQLSALGNESPMGDSEMRPIERDSSPGAGMKAKIDAIEQQMVGQSTTAGLRRVTDFSSLPTERLPLREIEGFAPTSAESTIRPAAPPAQPVPNRPAPESAALTFSAIESAPVVVPDAVSPGTPAVAHDPELDEAVIAFANADFALCEQVLAQLTQAQGSRAQHAETWLALFDLYRATGEAAKFERLALVYAHRFSRSAPQWYSMPQELLELTRDDAAAPNRIEGQAGWVCPEWLDVEQVAVLRAQTLQMPLPWMFDWNGLEGIDTEAAMRLRDLLHLWMDQRLEMRWIGGEHLLQRLQEAAPHGVRDADPVFWMLRLDVLRMINRPDRFDETAIDYCVTYEMSPPSWQPTQCRVKFDGSGNSSWSPHSSLVSGLSTSFVESGMAESLDGAALWSVNLSGQLTGDISHLLSDMISQMGSASVVQVSCRHLMRLDFIAAGDLLNWLLARRAESRQVTFVDAHRLVALFFAAMGINEHALIKIRAV
jgi:hypothetical protein